MRRTSAPIYAKDGEVFGHLDLEGARWSGGEDVESGTEVLEVAFVRHIDGVIYTAVRRTPPMPPEDLVVVYTPLEWELFCRRAAQGYFDPDTVRARHYDAGETGSGA